MAATIVDTVIGGDNLNTTSFETAALTVSGSNRVVWAWVSSGATVPVDPASVKYGGVSGASMTLIGTVIDVDVNVKLSLWEIIAPSVGTGTIYASWGATPQDERWVYAVSAQDAHQTTPKGTVATATGAVSTAVTVNVSSTAGQLVLDGCSVLNTSAASPTLSVGAGQTQLENLGATLAPYEVAAGSSETAAGASTTMSWTISALSDWGIIAFAVNDAVGGGDPPTSSALSRPATFQSMSMGFR